MPRASSYAPGAQMRMVMGMDIPPPGCAPSAYKLFVGNIPRAYSEPDLLPVGQICMQETSVVPCSATVLGCTSWSMGRAPDCSCGEAAFVHGCVLHGVRCSMQTSSSACRGSCSVQDGRVCWMV